MIKQLLNFALISLIFSACGGGGASSADNTTPNNDLPVDETPQIEHLSGGLTSTADKTADAFSARSENMTDVERIQIFELGDDFFQNPWVAGSASTSSRDGLGGLFNNNACQDCHIRDGRGHAPDEGSTDFSSILFRAARTQITQEQTNAMLNATLANVGDTSVGGQLQQEAVAGVLPEVTLSVTYEPIIVTFDDGFQVELRKPSWHFTSLRAGEGFDFDADTLFSARVSPQMIGLGLLSLVSETDILAKQDISDSDGDGISGKANYVWSLDNEQIMLGRFGWKAGQPTLLEQAAGAFVNDMGLTNRIHQNESCLVHQTDCLATPNGNGDSVNEYEYEVSDTILDAIALYSAHLSVPQRQNAYDEDVQRGKTLFTELGCTSCHTPQYTTEFSTEHPELSEQVIFPYTDMLLHDMGSELADFTIDNEPGTSEQLYEFSATATEWRTPPLWGIGRAQVVDPEANFLHDGRARTIMEAVLWHGGEAEQAKQRVLALTASERADLLSFLHDL